MPDADSTMSRTPIWLDEAKFAWDHTEPSELLEWGADVSSKLPNVMFRRIKNIGTLLETVYYTFLNEFEYGLDAHHNNELVNHLGTRATTIKNNSVESISNTYEDLIALKTALINNPKETAPELIVSAIAFLSAAGGLDGDGGIPDMDLLFGIGAHRSIFTHSIISGAVLETLLYGLATFTGIIHKNLPDDHDAIWDLIHQNKDRYLEKIAQGASAGIAYHLLIDGTLQPAAYHDLPISLPMECHDVILESNAITEGLDVKNKSETFFEPRITRRRSDQRQANWIFWSAIGLHVTYRNQALILPEQLKSRLQPSHLSIIQKYGYWMQGLAKGELFPLTESQLSFKAVASGETLARNDFERSWILYIQTTSSLGTPDSAK